MNFFKRKEKVDPMSDFINNYNKVNSDIEYMEKQYEEYILKSLEEDYVMVKDKLYDDSRSYGFSSSAMSTYWTVIDFDPISMTLMKYQSPSGVPLHKRIKLAFKHNGKISSSFEINYLDVVIGERTINLSKDKFRNILFKYHATFLVEKSKKKLDTTKKSFETLIDVIGQEYYRDSKIDSIINADKN